jgi:hypothetical protein
MIPDLPPFAFYIWGDQDGPADMPSPIPPSGLDKASGFTHLSTSKWVPRAAARHHASFKILWLLEVDTELCVENGGVFRWVEGPDGGQGGLALVDEAGALFLLRPGWIRSVVALGRPQSKDWSEHAGPSE